MKRIIGIIAVMSLFLTTGFTAYATSPIFSAHTYLSAQSLQEREAELGIETKDDKEVFSINGNEKFFAVHSSSSPESPGYPRGRYRPPFMVK